METTGGLFLLYKRRHSKAGIRSFMLPENAYLLNSMIPPLVPLPCSFLISWLVPLPPPSSSREGVRGLLTFFSLSDSLIHSPPVYHSPVPWLQFLCWEFLILTSHLRTNLRFPTAPFECSTIASNPASKHIMHPLPHQTVFSSNFPISNSQSSFSLGS